jgi:two-component system, LytTR family, response regulator LytT
MAYSVLLVDDEYLALDLLENFCSRLPDLQLVGKIRTPLDAQHFLNQETVDILFLDIQMPMLNGTNLLRTLRRPPVTIFTTAYAEYAVEAFDLNAVDYLLKPFSFERFLQAIGKAREHLMKQQNPTPAVSAVPEKELPEYLVCKVDGRLEKIFFNDIIAVEGMREYVKIICTGKYYITLESMKNMEENLPASAFVRTHKSWIVAKHRVKTLDGNILQVEKLGIPVSRERKDEVVKAIFG